MATIDDIARAAGVSNTTVTNVIHNRTNRVSADTIARVKSIIAEFGYVPNMSARALAAGSSKVVALINHLDVEKSGNITGDPFHAAIVGAIEQALRSLGYYFMLRSVSNARELLEFLANWKISGLFFTGLFEGTEIYTVLQDLDIPVVTTDSFLSNYEKIVNVGLDDRRGGYLAGEYLVKKGHRKIVFAGPPIQPGGVVEKRLAGFRQALDDHGVPFSDNLIYLSEFSSHVTIELGKQIAQRTDVTAIFATADIMAAGIMAGIQQSGKSVPGDFSIVGFDDINWCRLINPGLTTVHQDASAKGALAARQMVSLLMGNEVEHHNIIMPVSIKERQSVAQINP